MDVLKYMRRNYDKEPHPCLALVIDVLHEDFGYFGDSPETDKRYSAAERGALVLEYLAGKCSAVPLDAARPGDVVLLASSGHHVGIVVTTKEFIHVPDAKMGVVCERFDSPYIANRIRGVYRPKR